MELNEETISFIEEAVKEYGKDPLFKEEIFMNILINKGMEEAVSYCGKLYSKRCRTLYNLAKATYTDYILDLSINDKAQIFLTIANDNYTKADCIHIYMNSDWNYIKRAINNSIELRNTKECPLCMEEMEYKIITCSTCSKMYCLDCACNLMQHNKGYAICPFCKDEKGYITEDTEDYKKEYLKYVTKTKKDLKKNNLKRNQ